MNHPTDLGTPIFLCVGCNRQEASPAPPNNGGSSLGATRGRRRRRSSAVGSPAVKTMSELPPPPGAAEEIVESIEDRHGFDEPDDEGFGAGLSV